MNAHDKLYQDDERQQEVDGGEGDVIREVDLLALASFEPKNIKKIKKSDQSCFRLKKKWFMTSSKVWLG